MSPLADSTITTRFTEPILFRTDDYCFMRNFWKIAYKNPGTKENVGMISIKFPA